MICKNTALWGERYCKFAFICSSFKSVFPPDILQNLSFKGKGLWAELERIQEVFLNPLEGFSGPIGISQQVWFIGIARLGGVRQGDLKVPGGHPRVHKSLHPVLTPTPDPSWSCAALHVQFCVCGDDFFCIHHCFYQNVSWAECVPPKSISTQNFSMWSS